MMVKILSQAGQSLADMYDVVGSIAGIEELETRSLPIVHEMGATVFSERFQTAIRRVVSAATAQSTAITLVIDDLPAGVTRLLGVQVFSDDASRIANASVSVMQPSNTSDFPVWIWGGITIDARIFDAGSVQTFELMLPAVGTSVFPVFTGGSLQRQSLQEIRVRAITTAFGAGDVTLTAKFFVAFVAAGGVSPLGSRIPSW